MFIVSNLLSEIFIRFQKPYLFFFTLVAITAQSILTLLFW